MPLVKRARGYRLYDTRGRRYLDLYQNGGRALLGHRGQRVTKTLKNVIAAGLIGDLPSVYLGRMLKALKTLFPGFVSFRVAASYEAAMQMVSDYVGSRVGVEDVYDPAICTERQQDDAPRVALWRPFLEDGCYDTCDAVIPVLPFAMGGAPVAVCFRQDCSDVVPVSDPVSPVLLAGSLRSISDMRSHQCLPWHSDPRLDHLGGWSRRGIYLVSALPFDRYAEVFVGSLRQGVLLSPCFPGPSILPAEASPGEIGKLVELLGTPGGPHGAS